MDIRIIDTQIERHDISTRMPFKYGIATMTEVPHCFVRVKARFDDQEIDGISADHLPPKWFTKDPDKDPHDEIDDMLRVIKKAGQHAKEISATSVFSFWQKLYNQQDAWATAQKLPPLLAHFGTSLFERALIDAFCRYRQSTFSALLQQNAFGIEWSQLRPQLDACQPKDLLPAKPLSRINVRHTVGLADYILDADIPDNDRIADGLPQSLESCIRFYGTKDLKIKVNGDLGPDIKRLKTIAQLLQTLQLEDYIFTLDGNEQFKDVPSFRHFWETLQRDPQMKAFLENLYFVEQPFHRDTALDSSIGVDLHAWADAPPIIIDESDGSLDALPRALGLGYRGTSHKNCKGVFKGIMNRSLINLLNREKGDEHYVMSGEDLANIGPIANHQDLVVQATLGNHSVERNGHHYFQGLSVFGSEIQKNALKNFPNLYTEEKTDYPRLAITDGYIQTADLLAIPFGADDSHFTPEKS